MRGLFLTAFFVALTFAGTPLPTQADAATSSADLSMGATDLIELDLQGTGWALIRVTASEELGLTFSLTHDTIDDLCVFSDAGDGIYDQGHLTGFFLWDPETFVWGNEFFMWHGTPYWSVWPTQSGDCGVSNELSLDAGDTFHFMIADTTGGYTATLKASEAGDAGETVTVPLGPHPGLVRVDPEPSETSAYSGDGLQVLRERHWGAPLTLTENVVLIAGWDNHAGAYGSLAWEDKGVVPAGSPIDTPYTAIPFVEWSTGGSGDGRSTTGVHWQEPGDFEARYSKADSTAAPTGHFYDGAYMVSFPLVE